MSPRAMEREAVFREVERQTFERVFNTFLVVRLWVAPVVMVLLMGVALIDPVAWRRWAVAIVFPAAMVLFWKEWRRVRHQGMGGLTLPVNLGMMAVIQLVAIGITGAVESPIMPALFVLATVLAVTLGRRPALWVVIGIQASAVVFLAAGQVLGFLPDVNLQIFGGGHRAGHNDALMWSMAAFSVVVLLVVATLGSGIRDVFNGMVRRALEVREDYLDAHAAQARELQALSGEIAHELKNPLASIKGLAALVAREVPAGRSAERLAVLRAEIERMQAILDEFLNFSRPLVPLSLETVDLNRVCAEVADLYEAVARQARVQLVVTPGAAAVRCDPRKIKQVLINLVQNGVEASPPRGLLRLSTRVAGPRVIVEVADQGQGPAPELAQRAFEPGVTGKPGGSGIGLTVARAIARQHGGDLRLETGPEGCTAVLELPAEAEA